MKTRLVSESRAAKRCAPLAGSAFCASDRRTSHPSATLLLRIQQSSPHHEQIRQRGTDFEPVQILRESAVTHLLEAEEPLDHPNRVLDLRAHPRNGNTLMNRCNHEMPTARSEAESVPCQQRK